MRKEDMVIRVTYEDDVCFVELPELSAIDGLSILLSIAAELLDQGVKVAQMQKVLGVLDGDQTIIEKQ